MKQKIKFKLLELRPYMIDENSGVYEMLQEIPKNGEFNQENNYNGLTKEEVKTLICKMMQHAYGFNVDDEDFPQSENYILFANDYPVCIGGLTLKLTDYWKTHRGSFWYKTRPSERNKGYATEFLKQICLRAKELGFTEIIGQCYIDHIVSSKVMEKNGFKKYINPLCPDWDDTSFYKKML